MNSVDKIADDYLLAVEVMKWWEAHQYDTYGEYGDYNVYDDEPSMVPMARQIIDKAFGRTS